MFLFCRGQLLVFDREDDILDWCNLIFPDLHDCQTTED